MPQIIESEVTNTLRQELPGAETARSLVIAGSGLGGFVSTVDIVSEISFGDIPGVGDSTVQGHSGRLVFAQIGEKKTPALIMSGRRHLYEGLTASEAVRLQQLILSAWPGVRNMVVSNAAGGLNRTFSVGDLMLITDHVNWMFRNSLRGAGTYLCDPLHRPVFDPALRALALETAQELSMGMRQGVYLSMMGPSYETRAEVLMCRNLLGADAVGMSTVPESIMAAALGRRVLGISFISNMLVDPAPLTHDEVVENSVLVEEKFSRLVAALIRKMHND